MATGTTNLSPTPPPVQTSPSLGDEGERYIETRLAKTRLQVKLVDLFSSLMLLSVGIVSYVLILACIDHWGMELAIWSRWLALVVLLGGVLVYSVRAVAPLLFREINPIYVAQQIEQGQPALKNSLINFLLLRNEQHKVRVAVLKAMRQRAAVDLSAVSVDTAVDRSKVIRMGYVLIAVLLASAIYIMLSPKDIFQTVRRIGAPWADIERPARVAITRVSPGTKTVFYGQMVSVSADVQGVSEDDSVKMIYRTLDGRVEDRIVAMNLSADGFQYECEVPESSAGIQQDLKYRIVAGDATTESYRLTVLPAPTILIERVEYKFPVYTGRPPRVVERQGDLEAIEGTTVTLHARANQPIHTANVDFDPLLNSPHEQGMHGHGLVMKCNDRDAEVSFVLELQDDRRTPVHLSYQTWFKNLTGVRSQQPILHQINVIADLSPEVEILSPVELSVEVPQDGQQLIEVRAIDPDFALSELQVVARTGEKQVFREVLMVSETGKVGQVIERFDFRPATYGLVAGEEVIVFAVATDNRGSASNEQFQPNTGESEAFLLRIVAPEGLPAQEEGDGLAGEEEGNGGKPTEPVAEMPPEAGEEMPSEDAEARQGDEQGDGDKEDQVGNTSSAAGQSEDSAEELSGDSSSEQSAGNAAAGKGETSPSGNTGSDSSETESGQEGIPTGEGNTGEGNTNPSDEPLHDGEVFEKALEHFAERDRQDASREGAAEQTSQPPGNTPAAAADESSEAGSEAAAAAEPSPATAQESSSQQGDQSNTTGGDTENAAEGPAKENSAEQSPQDAGSPEAGAAGTADQEGSKQDEAQDVGKDPGLGDAGEAGAGNASEEKKGAPESTGNNRDSAKKPTSNNSEASPSDPAQSSSASNKQSDSEGSTSGDQSGGGGKGGGQGANQAGNDTAGSNTSADQGNAGSNESGVGETSERAGEKQAADGKTGQTGEQSGQGSGLRETASSQGGKDKSADALTPGPSSENNSGPDQDGDAAENQDGQGRAGNPTGGGIPGDDDGRLGNSGGVVPPGEAANLDYARQATDLVLERLEDQDTQAEQELLDKLGWTQAELQEFLERWKKLRRTAATGDASGQHELTENLRSLGLRRSGLRVRQGELSDDDMQGLQESSDLSRPPAELFDRFNSYKKGVSRAANSRRD